MSSHVAASEGQAATAMACEDGRRMDQESAYLGILGQTSTWAIEDGTLVLRSATGQTFAFRAAEEDS